MLLFLKIWFWGAGSFQFLFQFSLVSLSFRLNSLIILLFLNVWNFVIQDIFNFSVFLSFFGVFVISAYNGLANSLQEVEKFPSLLTGDLKFVDIVQRTF